MIFRPQCIVFHTFAQVETYWKSHPEEVNDAPHAHPSTSTNQADDSIVSDFDRHRLSQLKNGNNSDTWGAEV